MFFITAFITGAQSLMSLGGQAAGVAEQFGVGGSDPDRPSFIPGPGGSLITGGRGDEIVLGGDFWRPNTPENMGPIMADILSRGDYRSAVIRAKQVGFSADFISQLEARIVLQKSAELAEKARLLALQNQVKAASAPRKNFGPGNIAAGIKCLFGNHG